jgi:tripartite-type tricarboxylate transporter receptor subunit TctC
MTTPRLDPPARSRLRLLAAALACTAAAITAGPASAQQPAWPAKPVRFVVSLAAGGAVDVMARLVAQQVSTRIGQPVIVENRPGGAGTIAAQAVARAAPDGYTLLVGPNLELTMTVSMTARPSYDPLRDLAPVVKAANAPQVVFVTTASGIGSMKELLDRARREGGRMSYATSAPGSQMHMTMEGLKEGVGVAWEHIAYKGAAPVITDVLGGQLAFGVTSIAAINGPMRAGKLRPLAILTPERSSLLPDVPTLREATGAAVPDYPVWYAFTAPAGTPRDVLARLEEVLIAALSDPEVSSKLVAQGLEVLAQPASRYAPTLPGEIATFATAIRRMKISLD